MLTYARCMQIIRHEDAPLFDAAGTTMRAYAAPSRGAAEVSMWQIELAPGSTSPLHFMDREEVFLGLAGEAVAAVGDAQQMLRPGDCLILPAGTAFTLHVPGEQPFRALACLPAGALA